MSLIRIRSFDWAECILLILKLNLNNELRIFIKANCIFIAVNFQLTQYFDVIFVFYLGKFFFSFINVLQLNL
jgi:hypothetical protein